MKNINTNPLADTLKPRCVIIKHLFFITIKMEVVRTTDADGNQFWRLDSKLHRLDGPAVIYASGEQHWYFNDKHHREDGPAIIYVNGTQCWYINGKLHRAPHNGEPMPVILRSQDASFNGKDYITITAGDYDKYRYQPTGRHTKAALRDN